MYESAGTSVSDVGAGVGAAFGSGVGGACRFCCAVVVTMKVMRSRKMAMVGRVIAFMGVKPLVYLATKSTKDTKDFWVPFCGLSGFDELLEDWSGELCRVSA